METVRARTGDQAFLNRCMNVLQDMYTTLKEEEAYGTLFDIDKIVIGDKLR
jgi:hypothetical protein